MNIPNIPHQSTPFIMDGNIHPNWYLYFSQITDQLQQNQSEEGNGIPKQTTSNIATIEASNPSPRIIYDSDMNLAKIAINGVFKTIATLLEVLIMGFDFGQFAGGAGGIANGLFDMFGAENPSNAAMPYYNKIPGMLNQQYSPWINAGEGAIPGMQQYEARGNTAGNELMGQYNQMTNDPSGLINKLGAGFKQSPGYAFQTNQSLQAANRAAAAGGMAGSPEEQQNIAGITNQMANQDYYNYLNHSQQLYGAGINGLQGTQNLGAQVGQGMMNTGAQASNNLAQNLGATYMNQGNLAYQGANSRNQMMGGGIGSFLGGAADIASMFF